jgi:HEAT repeat protein
MALFELRYEHLPAHLIHLARDPSSSSRRLAAFYLGELRVAQALGVVAELTQDKSPNVRAAARAALKRLKR